MKAFVRKTDPGTTQVFEEDGKYIFAPGGNLTVSLPVTKWEHKVNGDRRIRIGLGYTRKFDLLIH